MSATLAAGQQPAPPGWLAELARDLRPAPGRLADSVRLVALVLATVAIGKTFRMPEVAVSAYVVLFVSRNERSSTITTAVVAGAAVILAVFATIAVYMASLSQPALRVPAIAVVTFAGVFLSRVSPLGPAAFAAGFIMAYGLTAGDAVMALAAAPSGISNTTGLGLPNIAFIPPEESLLQFLLWMAPVVALPVGLVVAGNLLTGRQPETLLRDGLADRLAACADFCAGLPGSARALAASARQGSAAFAKLYHFAGAAPLAPDYGRLIPQTERLALALLAWDMIATPAGRQRALAPCAQALRAAELALRTQAAMAVTIPAPLAESAAGQPLADEIAEISAALSASLNTPAPAAPAKTGARQHLVSAAAMRDPQTLRHALKVTLSVMLAYAAESLLDWPAIHTCVVTCFFVALTTIGESMHKAALRITGALIGGALGIATILLLMPVMTDLGALLLAVAVVTLLAGWVANGSERIAYAGWQIGMAYYLTVLQGCGPTLDMQTARDRVVGIVLGNLIVLGVFSIIWPVRVAHAVRGNVADAITQLAAMMRLGPLPPEALAEASAAPQAAFAAATTAARGLMANAGYERLALGHGRKDAIGQGEIDSAALADLDAIMLAQCVILNQEQDRTWVAAPPAARQAALAYHGQMARWLERCAGWVMTGAGLSAIAADMPLPPLLDAPGLAGLAAWHGVLNRQLRTVMARMAQRGQANA